MNKSQLLALADRVEALTGPDREVFGEAFLAHDPGPSPFGCSSYHNQAISAWNERKNRFIAFVDAGAWLDAAMSLVPEGMIARRYIAGRLVPHMWEVSRSPDNGGWFGISDHASALALTAASLRAMAMAGGDDGKL